MTQQFFFTVMIALSIAYAGFMLWCLSGWIKLPVYPLSLQENERKTFVSVIIPARNEEEHVLDCLNDFLRQDYPFDLFELIVVDDHSDDATAKIATKFMNDFPELKIRILQMSAGSGMKTYKKQAITEGIKISTGALVITTDADCRRGHEWIGTIAGYFEKCGPAMISAPVIFENENSWLERIQSLEFLGLVAIGAASIGNGKPFLCNGANLAFSKKIFMEVGGYRASMDLASGDDTLLMMKVAAKDPGLIHFIKSQKATVRTTAKKTLAELLSQRRRWASKIPSQMNSFTVLIACIAYFLHAGLVVSFLYFLYSGSIYSFLIPFLVKVTAEFVFVANVANFFNKSRLLFLFLPAQVIYPFYISYVGIRSLYGNYEWKGRNIK